MSATITEKDTTAVIDTTRARRVNKWVLAGVAAVVLIVTALAGYALAVSRDAAGLTAASDDAETVAGTADCSVRPPRADAVMEYRTSELHIACELDGSDARVSGTEDMFIRYHRQEGTTETTWTAESVLESEEGTWRGTGQGVHFPYESLVSETRAAGSGQIDVDAPGAHYGVMQYTGEGAYDGLTFQYHFAGTERPHGDVRYVFSKGLGGWIDADVEGG